MSKHHSSWSVDPKIDPAICSSTINFIFSILLLFHTQYLVTFSFDLLLSFLFKKTSGLSFLKGQQWAGNGVLFSDAAGRLKNGLKCTI